MNARVFGPPARKFRWIAAVLFFLPMLGPVRLQAQGRPEPLSKDEALEVLKSPVLRPRIAQMAAGLGLNFELTAETESEWRKAGLTDAHLKEIWEAFGTRALSYTRTLNTALVTYAKTYNKGFPATLAELGPPAAGAKPSASRADMIADWLVSGKTGNSYRFTYSPTTPGPDGGYTKYIITARPTQWHEGARNFFTDESAAIRETREDRAATAQDPPIGKR